MTTDEAGQLRDLAIHRVVAGSYAAQADVVGKALGCLRVLACGPYGDASGIAADTLRAVAGDA
jgi:hypothetical protein